MKTITKFRIENSQECPTPTVMLDENVCRTSERSEEIGIKSLMITKVNDFNDLGNLYHQPLVLGLEHGIM
jgi:hypothetical protein